MCTVDQHEVKPIAGHDRNFSSGIDGTHPALSDCLLRLCQELGTSDLPTYMSSTQLNTGNINAAHGEMPSETQKLHDEE